MPVLATEKQDAWKSRFVGVEVNHNSRVFHEQAGCSSSSMTGGVVELDLGSVARSSAFTSRQELEEREASSCTCTCTIYYTYTCTCMQYM